MPNDIKERGILFKGEMVRALLNTRIGTWPPEPINAEGAIKGQTRRVIKPQPKKYGKDEWPHIDPGFDYNGCLYPRNNILLKCPYGKPGDRLWVRETWAPAHYSTSHEYQETDFFKWIPDMHGELLPNAPGLSLHYRADGEDNNPAEFSMPHGNEIGWRPSIFMPRWASRIDGEVMLVRVERVQDISWQDALAEGVDHSGRIKHLINKEDARCELAQAQAMIRFKYLWDTINAKPKPCYETVDGKKVITHYESFPWEDIQETREHRGKPWYVRGNPWVWVVEFRRIK
jgi:hypothetical protein